MPSCPPLRGFPPAVALVPFFALALVAQAGGPELRLCRHPAVSPDGSTISFSHQGYVWMAPAAGGLATRITSHAAREDVTAWSPDGRTLAFQSNRNGNNDVFVVDLMGGEPRRL